MNSFINLKLMLSFCFLLQLHLIMFVKAIRKRRNNEMVRGDRGNSLLRVAFTFNLGKKIRIMS
jgi:hypothetical protein